jgi:hypothetical protein
MKKTAQAKIIWMPPEMGGRKLITTGIRYCIPARFEDEADKRPPEAWSLFIELLEPPNESLETIATVWLLVGDDPDAPNYLLHSESRFELFDGNVIVARGQVFS